MIDHIWSHLILSQNAPWNGLSRRYDIEQIEYMAVDFGENNTFCSLHTFLLDKWYIDQMPVKQIMMVVLHWSFLRRLRQKSVNYINCAVFYFYNC